MDVVAFDDALTELSRMNPEHGRIEETAQAMGISPTTIKRDWAVARAWLYRELARTTPL